ncbi:nucleoside diphosphate kinase 7-like isoform X1 [Argonauta hians]
MFGGSSGNQHSDDNDKRYSFVVDWYDIFASLTRRYTLLYYPKDKSVEMYEYKKHRVFLRRTICESLNLADLYIGNVVYLFSRHLNIIDFADDFTKKELGFHAEKTLGLLNAKAIPKMADILELILKNGFKITKMKMCVIGRKEALEFCELHKDDDFFNKMVERVCEAPVLALELLGKDAVCTWYKTCGPENVDLALESGPPSIAAYFSEGGLCYGPRNSEEAAQQLEFFFPSSSGVYRKNTAVYEDCTLCIIKPHAVASNLTPKIVRAITDAGFEITSIQMFNLDSLCAEEFFEVYRGVVPEFSEMVSQLSSGPIIAIALRAKDAPKAFREMAGPVDPEIARQLRPRSLRAIFGKDKIRNAVHCTDLPEDGVLEVEYFFKILDK